MSDTPQHHPADSSTPDDTSATATADRRSGSRRGRIVAVLLVSLLVGAGTFVLMAVGQAF